MRKYLPEIKTMHHVLTVVKHEGEFPKGKAWMYSRLKSEGLVRMQTKKTEMGGTVYGKVKLTKKGKDLLGSFQV